MRVRVGSLDFSVHGMVGFKMLKGGKKPKSIIITLDFRRLDFSLFRDTFGKILYNMVHHHLLQAQGWSIPM